MNRTTMTRTVAARGWGAGTAVLGAAMLIGPRAVAGLVSSGASSPSPVIVQVLGARQLLQGAAVMARPGRRLLLTGGSVVDVLHAGSMLAAARWWPRYRQPALTSAAVAAGSAVVGGLISRRWGP